MSEWQPIETANLEAKEILLWGVLRNQSQPWKYIGSWFPSRSGGWWVSHGLPIQPTLWAELPPAPTTHNPEKEE